MSVLPLRHVFSVKKKINCMRVKTTILLPNFGTFFSIRIENASDSELKEPKNKICENQVFNIF